MIGPFDDVASPPDGPGMTLFGGLLIPFLGLGMLHAVMSAFDAMFV
jgi:hypothetical protein